MPKSEGSLTFWLHHDHSDWMSNEFEYRFGPFSVHGLTASAVKTPSQVIEVELHGLRVPCHFEHPLPANNDGQVFVAITWTRSVVVFFLNAEQVAQISLPAKSDVSGTVSLLSDLVLETCIPNFGLNSKQVAITANEPDQQHIFTMLGNREKAATLQLKCFGSFWMFTLCSHTANKDYISLALKIFPDLMDEFSEATPLEVLSAITSRFGFPVQIGDKSSVLFLRADIPIAFDGGELFRVNRPPSRANDPFIQSMFVKVESNGRFRTVCCALAFCLDVKNYGRWLKSH